MKRSDKVPRIQRTLDNLIPLTPIPLRHKDPYTLLVSVLLSAQCTDKRVNEVTPILFREASSPTTMARLPLPTIRRIIRPCGLAPAKSKAIKALSKILVRDHDGEVPEDWAALEALPGIGHKSASVVMSQAFDKPAFPVDTHIHRLATRWGLSSGKNVVQTERDLKKLFPEESWGKLHLQIIYFGRQYCPARGHDLTQCPICSWAATKKQVAAEMGRVSGG